MRISAFRANKFKRFEELNILRLPESARLVIIAGPNGSGKSSLFEAFRSWHWAHGGENSIGEDSYYDRPNALHQHYKRVQVDFHGRPLPQINTEEATKLFYFRSAYRNEPALFTSKLERLGPLYHERRFNKMIENDQTVLLNYQRLTSDLLEDLFVREPGSTSVADFRERMIGPICESLKRLFPDLVLSGLGNPLQDGSFFFDKGTVQGFAYQNLSGGEKAAFDLLLDLLVKRRFYNDTVFCIDEPEAHMHTRLQGALLRELVRNLPGDSQLWIATHSIGMMRAGRDMNDEEPGSVAFIDFTGHDFDQRVTLQPVKPSRVFWEKVLNVALDDLANLVAPERVIICEGNPVGTVVSKNAENDAICYNTIFEDEFPETMFVSGGNSSDVKSDRMVLAGTVKKIAKGIELTRVIDRDDHSPTDVVAYEAQNVRVLSRRNLECYLFDDEVLQALCKDAGKDEEYPALLQDKAAALSDLPRRGKPIDDVASAAGPIYTKAKARLGLTAVGNDYGAFMRYKLAPLLKPEMKVYQELRAAIFGS
jgi:hypothetical protein